MRTYETTHPWLKFTLDLNRIDYESWTFLGEAQSKCEHIAGEPLMPETAKNLHQIYLAKGLRGTTAIEGNTLSEEEVIDRIEGKLELPPSKEYLGQEIDNIINACNSVADKLFEGGSVNLCVEDIKNFNKMVLEKLPLEKEIIPGEIRTYSAGVARYRAAPPQDCEYLLEKLCEWLNTNFTAPKEENRVVFGILKAIIAHLYFVWIHPFGDGDGRTARMIEFQTLIISGIPSAAAHLLSNHYNETRKEYYIQLDEASKIPNGEFSFIKYALKGFVDGLREQLEVVKKQQLDVTWENHIYDVFKGKDSLSDRRRRHLILDLSNQKEPMSKASKITEITPRIATAYSKKTEKTLRRDLKELLRLDLIKVEKDGIIANKEKIRAFLPRLIKN
jgi:Fic family protein